MNFEMEGKKEIRLQAEPLLPEGGASDGDDDDGDDGEDAETLDREDGRGHSQHIAISSSA